MWIQYLSELVKSNIGNVICVRINNFMRWCIERGYDVDMCKKAYYQMLRALDGTDVNKINRRCLDKFDVEKILSKHRQ